MPVDPFFHVLNVHKQSGMTSRDVVNRVQRLVRPAKAGHAGTLDPLASGVLVICLGQATRLIEYVQRMQKTYRGTFMLGRHSPTEDIEGVVEELTNPPQPTLPQITAAAQQLTGNIMQRPPAFSALKVAGQRAYALARKGEEVTLAPRPITIYRLSVSRYEYPELQLEIECSSGTYVRSLGRDLAESLGTAAVMSALVRTAIGEFDLTTAVDTDRLTRDNLSDYLLPATTAVRGLPRIEITDVERATLAKGVLVEISLERLDPKQTEVAAVNHAGELVALLGPQGDGLWRPLRNFGVESVG